MELHFSANTPDLGHISIAQHPVPLNRIGDVHHTARLRLQPLRGVVCKLGERLSVRDSHADGDTGAPQHLGADLPAESVEPANSGEVGECFVYLKERCQPMDMSEAHANSSFPLNTP